MTLSPFCYRAARVSKRFLKKSGDVAGKRPELAALHGYAGTVPGFFLQTRAALDDSHKLLATRCLR